MNTLYRTNLLLLNCEMYFQNPKNRPDIKFPCCHASIHKTSVLLLPVFLPLKTVPSSFVFFSRRLQRPRACWQGNPRWRLNMTDDKRDVEAIMRSVTLWVGRFHFKSFGGNPIQLLCRARLARSWKWQLSKVTGDISASARTIKKKKRERIDWNLNLGFMVLPVWSGWFYEVSKIRSVRAHLVLSSDKRVRIIAQCGFYGRFWSHKVKAMTPVEYHP